MNVLGIETSCDETSAAVLSDGPRVLSNIISSQANLHARYGGVVPEVASRMHVENMLPVIDSALSQAGLKASATDISGIAVTNRPGLLGALLVGVSAAKAMGCVLGVPVVTVHHLEGHIYSSFITAPDLENSFPILVLIVSGGHTQIVRMDGHGQYTILGKTRDDAAGEAFDKGARLLGLPYPGGPNIARLAEEGDESAVKFPRAVMGDNLDFSFSGVKTALRTYVLNDNGATPAANIAAGYQASVVGSLVARVRKACKDTGIRTVCVAGGVAANRKLKSELQRVAAIDGFRVVIPEPELCTDNAAMIACAGYYRLQRGVVDALDFDTYATETLGA
jgi:N6-L-threonylcarbamoyladenine synthase